MSNLFHTGSRADSKYFGVYHDISRPKRKWRAMISLGEKRNYKHIGYFDDEVEAAKAHDLIGKEMSNKVLNFGM